MRLRSWGLRVREWVKGEIDKFKKLEDGNRMRELSFVFDDSSLVLIRVKQGETEMAVTPGELFNGVGLIEDYRNQILNGSIPVVDEVQVEGGEGKKEGEPVMSSQTPFGTFQSDIGLPKAPTKEEVAVNPGAYEGTSFDPTNLIVPNVVIEKFATLGPGYEISADGERYEKFTGGTLADWYKVDAQAALAWYENMQGFPLNVNALTPGQKGKMGINVKEVTK